MDAFIKYISYILPEKELPNEEFIKLFPEWNVEKIVNKVGIKTRRIADENQSASDLAVEAINQLCKEYPIDKQHIDFLIICTQSPDYFLPATACIVQDKAQIGVHCGALDINQGCSGYVYGLSLAKGLIVAGIAKNVLLVTAEMYSKHLHPTDKKNWSIFGDGASATLISTEGTYKIGNFSLGTDGSGAKNLIVRNGAFKHPKTADLESFPNDNFLYMDGPEIFRFTNRAVPYLVQETLDKNDETLGSIDQYVFHQANTYMINSLREKIGIPEEKFIIDMKDYGNTVSTTIPIVLKNLISKSENKEKILLAGFGVGYSWGGTVIYKEN
ncbi:MAG: ketoacyl-ACP synthase III [Flavobacteriaceae bacterium]|jgi:3-oxoacyl-[acyl-carrier-protein] synthase-3|nr:ketoacyl-ACP synthase III [Flavobacteriaceae bacterium]